MAPIKFEEQLKEKLEKRTIQPSVEAWSKLEDRLEQQDKKQNHRYIWWLGIAASIVGVILVTTFVFDASESKTMTPTVVDSKNDEKLNDKVSEDILVSQQDAIVNSESETIISEEDKVTQNNTKPSEVVSPKEQQSIKEAIASTDLKKKAPAQDPLETPVNNSDFEDAKLKEVVAEIDKLKTENALVTEQEIDSLLKQAERDILTNKLQRSNTRTVDANALLQDVEADLEQSFRSRVFETLLNNYETVKTAVAERNN